LPKCQIIFFVHSHENGDDDGSEGEDYEKGRREFTAMPLEEETNAGQNGINPEMSVFFPFSRIEIEFKTLHEPHPFSKKQRMVTGFDFISKSGPAQINISPAECR
jgi:hypothetical protein